MSESPKTYGPEQENAFFQGVLAAAEETAPGWGVSANVIVGDMVSNCLACLLVEADEQDFAGIMNSAEQKAAAVLRTRALRKDVTGE